MVNKPNIGAVSLADQLLTPNIFQPAPISQNNIGGLWL